MKLFFFLSFLNAEEKIAFVIENTDYLFYKEQNGKQTENRNDENFKKLENNLIFQKQRLLIFQSVTKTEEMKIAYVQLCV